MAVPTFESSADFTVRDVNRRLAKVLAECDRLGAVRIRSREGHTYELRPAPPEAAPETAAPGRPDFAARRKAIGLPKMTKSHRARLDKLIRGE
jgi:hypothetical protein